MLYVCEGTKLRRDKRGENRYIYGLDLTNCNPHVIALFIKFLVEIMHVDFSRVKGQLFIYPDHDPIQLIQYWSNVSSIPANQFQKIIVLKQKNSKYKPNPLGTFKIRYTNKDDFLKLQRMIDDVWRDAGVV